MSFFNVKARVEKESSGGSNYKVVEGVHDKVLWKTSNFDDEQEWVVDSMPKVYSEISSALCHGPHLMFPDSGAVLINASPYFEAKRDFDDKVKGVEVKDVVHQVIGQKGEIPDRWYEKLEPKQRKAEVVRTLGAFVGGGSGRSRFAATHSDFQKSFGDAIKSSVSYPLCGPSSFCSDQGATDIDLRALWDILEILRLKGQIVPGITNPVINVGIPGRAITLNRGEMNMSRISVVWDVNGLPTGLEQGSKWILAISPMDNVKLQTLMMTDLTCRDIFAGDSIYIADLNYLASKDIAFQVLEQSPGWMLVAYGFTCGLYTGFVLDETVHFATLYWAGYQLFDPKYDEPLRMCVPTLCTCPTENLLYPNASNRKRGRPHMGLDISKLNSNGRVAHPPCNMITLHHLGANTLVSSLIYRFAFGKRISENTMLNGWTPIQRRRFIFSSILYMGYDDKAHKIRTEFPPNGLRDISMLKRILQSVGFSTAILREDEIAYLKDRSEINQLAEVFSKAFEDDWTFQTFGHTVERQIKRTPETVKTLLSTIRILFIEMSIEDEIAPSQGARSKRGRETTPEPKDTPIDLTLPRAPLSEPDTTAVPLTLTTPKKKDVARDEVIEDEPETIILDRTGQGEQSSSHVPDSIPRGLPLARTNDRVRTNLVEHMLVNHLPVLLEHLQYADVGFVQYIAEKFALEVRGRLDNPQQALPPISDGGPYTCPIGSQCGEVDRSGQSETINRPDTAHAKSVLMAHPASSEKTRMDQSPSHDKLSAEMPQIAPIIKKKMSKTHPGEGPVAETHPGSTGKKISHSTRGKIANKPGVYLRSLKKNLFGSKKDSKVGPVTRSAEAKRGTEISTEGPRANEPDSRDDEIAKENLIETPASGDDTTDEESDTGNVSEDDER